MRKHANRSARGDGGGPGRDNPGGPGYSSRRGGITGYGADPAASSLGLSRSLQGYGHQGPGGGPGGGGPSRASPGVGGATGGLDDAGSAERKLGFSSKLVLYPCFGIQKRGEVLTLLKSWVSQPGMNAEALLDKVGVRVGGGSEDGGRQVA